MTENSIIAIIKNNEVRNFIGLQDDVDVNYTFQNGSTLLSWAIKKSDLNNIKCLIQKGASIHKRELGGATPLLLAVHLNRLEIVKYLVLKGANVNEGDSYDTPLTVAVRKEFLDIIEFLLNNGAIVSIHNIDGLSPIFWAIKNEKLKILEILTSKGIPENMKDQFGNSPITVAVKCGASKQIFKCLLKNGAQSNKLTLTWAAKHGNLVIIQALLEYGADVNITDPDGNTPLALAVRHKQTEVAKYLTTAGVNVYKSGKNGNTPLFYAVQNEDFELITWLLDHGANYIIDDVIFDAISTKNLKIIQLLHKKGANLKVCSKNNQTLLAKALEVEDIEVTKYLLEQGATFKKDLTSNETIYLLCFLEKKNYGMVKLLTENGANLNKVDKHTPLTLAIAMDDFEMVQYFVEHNADIHLKNQNNQSPLFIAARTNLKIFEYLVEAGANLDGDPMKGHESMQKFYKIAKEAISKRQQKYSEFLTVSNQEEQEETENFFDATFESDAEKRWKCFTLEFD